MRQLVKLAAVKMCTSHLKDAKKQKELARMEDRSSWQVGKQAREKEQKTVTKSKKKIENTVSMIIAHIN